MLSRVASPSNCKKNQWHGISLEFSGRNTRFIVSTVPQNLDNGYFLDRCRQSVLCKPATSRVTAINTEIIIFLWTHAISKVWWRFTIKRKNQNKFVKYKSRVQSLIKLFVRLSGNDLNFRRC